MAGPARPGPHRPLFEREGELAALRAAVGEVAGAEARALIVEGAAGIGKTRLLAEARRLATEAGLRVLAARGGELEREFAFGVVRQLFERAVAGDDPPALRGAAAPARRVLEHHEGVPGEEAGRGPDDTSFASLHGLYWLTVNLTADGPLAIAVDDLHWCDRPSLRFLAYLVRRLEGVPVLVAGTLRPREPGVDAALLGEIAADPLTMSIRPRPLSEHAAARLIRARLGEDADEAFSAACHTATGGNPLLLHELMSTLDAEALRPRESRLREVDGLGPRAVSRAVLVRLARLAPEAVRMARAVAVLGADADLSAVAALAEVGPDATSEAMAALVRAEILRGEPAVAFTHPLVGATVYRDMSSPERALAHARAARLLADAGASPERVAAHLLASPRRGEPWVGDTLTRAARAALRKGAAESAVAYLGRALAEPPPPDRRGDVLLELGAAEALTNGPAAVEHLQEAFASAGDPGRRGAAAQLLGRALLFTGHPQEAAALARRAAADLPPERHDQRQALEAFELMAVFFGADDPVTLTRLEAHRGLPVGPGLGAKMLAAVAAQEWAYGGGPSALCAELARQALAGGDLLAADSELLGAVAIVTLVLADRPEALDAWEASLAHAHRRGSLLAKCAVSLWHGFTMYRRGDLVDAEALLRTAAEELASWAPGESEGRVHCAAFLAEVRRERGDAAGARRALEEVGDPGDRSEGARYWDNARLELLLEEGRFAEALALADDAQRRFAFMRHPIDTPARTHAARALDGLGRGEEARALAAQELELARGWGAPGTVARALRVLGELEGESGLARLREAVDVVAPSPARLEHTKALAALGGALRGAGRPGEAREALRQALELADALGAQGIATRVRAELYAAGGRPRRTTLRGPAALTPRERRVAALAAAGQANREIAQALFVTPKTVELHLSNAYRKLGVRSRRELPGGLADPDPIPPAKT